MLRTSDFDYNLPKELIAQKPTVPRDQCRLLVLDRKSGQIEHKRFFEIIDYLKKGDVLVLNDSKVFKARLFGWLSLRADPPVGGGAKQSRASMGSPRSLAKAGSLAMTNNAVEVFLLRVTKNNIWEVLGNPGRKLKIGVRVYFTKEPLTPILSPKGRGEVRGQVWCEVIEQREGKYIVRFNVPNNTLMKWVARYGHVPVPPYIGCEPKRAEEYQTVYAQHLGSVAAPTAGFHFTKSLLHKLRRKGVEVHYLTLHVDYGTFKPIKTERVEEHQMDAEWVEIPESTVEAIARAKKEGRRVVAVGTTTVRALEGIYAACLSFRAPARNSIRLFQDKCDEISRFARDDKTLAFSGKVNIFITPGFEFQIVDALITNFHLPKSTLLLLVSALAGRDLTTKTYKEAVKKKYKFYSFGDAMLIL